ncbi:MAG TPA: GldG family protein, partial [Polyangiaceae bacterium]|nr:GldG family protein [Polyangiaceae bacterium]
MATARSRGRALSVLSAAGVIAATLLGISANVLVSRFYKRWDVTSRGLYTLSDATVDTLRGLGDPVEVIVFLSASDPLTVSVRHMLTAYGAETDKLRPRYVDPDRNPAEFLALQQKFGIVAGKTDDGRVVTDASIVVSRGSRNWFVTTDDIVVYDENDGQARPKLEQALTEAIRNVLERESARICFSVGHQEISIDDGGPSGLAELRYRLQKGNFEVETIDLAAPKLDRELPSCQVVVVAGPEVR